MGPARPSENTSFNNVELPFAPNYITPDSKKESLGSLAFGIYHAIISVTKAVKGFAAVFPKPGSWQ
jgi:hypothetical protein